MMCCPLSGGDNEASFYAISHPTAARAFACLECGEPVSRGVRYELTKGKWDGEWSTHKTCLSCVEIRHHFGCGSGWVYGCLWEDLEQNFFETMSAGGPCMEGLSPAAKARLIDRRMKWLYDCGVAFNGAPPPWHPACVIRPALAHDIENGAQLSDGW